MSVQNAELHRLGLKLKFVYSIVGLLLGLACIFAGAILGLYGVVGHTKFAASLFGLSTDLSDAAPGVVVFVVGIFMVFITRFRVRAVEYNSPQPLVSETSNPATSKIPELKHSEIPREPIPVGGGQGTSSGGSYSSISYTTHGSGPGV